MKLLLHTCCGPCSIYPVQILREQGLDVMGYFYRHNIHPYTECLKRQETLQTHADRMEFKLIVQEGYDVEGFLRDAVFRESERCRICYHRRLKATALVARKGKFDSFSTTLLYSKFQNHEAIREIGEAVAKTTGIAFHYHDFREGWQAGVAESKRLGMYRQQYCGCIYSEKDRYFK
ncbi:MAG: epoxyqueuosine reductase QueH [Desulfobacterales bacterium]|nr:epoxyqueuosine reductase QueH [Desulfobacterales bacterium]